MHYTTFMSWIYLKAYGRCPALGDFHAFATVVIQWLRSKSPLWDTILALTGIAPTLFGLALNYLMVAVVARQTFFSVITAFLGCYPVTLFSMVCPCALWRLEPPMFSFQACSVLSLSTNWKDDS